MTNDPTSAAYEDLREKLIDAIDDRRFDADYPAGMLYKDVEYAVDKLLPKVKQAIAEAETRGRVDENDIWLAHSTARRLNDNEPAIRTVDFQDRKAELQANADGANGRTGENTQ